MQKKLANNDKNCKIVEKLLNTANKLLQIALYWQKWSHNCLKCRKQLKIVRNWKKLLKMVRNWRKLPEFTNNSIEIVEIVENG